MNHLTHMYGPLNNGKLQLNMAHLDIQIKFNYIFSHTHSITHTRMPGHFTHLGRAFTYIKTGKLTY